MTGHVASDDLALYAAALLDPEDRAEVERHLEACTVCRTDLASAERTAWTMAEATARPTPAGLRQAIVGRHPRTARPARSAGFWVVAGRAAVVALAAALVLTATVLQATRADLEREAALASGYRAALAAVASGGRIVTLAPAAHAAGRGSVVVSRTGAVYLVLDMPAPPAGMTYEAWVIRGGTALPAGLAPARFGVVVVPLARSPRPGDTAAVTLETATGAEQPTSAPLLSAKL